MLRKSQNGITTIGLDVDRRWEMRSWRVVGGQ